jgi:hypothetical protein
MHRSLAKLVLTVALLSSGAMAAGRSFGLGVVFPAPTGITGKLWTSGTTALDFVFGWEGGYRDGYYDPACNNGRYYNDHRGYCDDYYYDYYDRGRYGRGWNNFHLHADYLFHNFSAIRSSERFPLFYGPGVNMNFWRGEFLELGVRGDFGIAWLPRRAPMDVFLELAPVVNLFPYARFDVNVGLGTRFYF